MDLHETRRFVNFLTSEILAHVARCTKAPDETAADVAREVLGRTTFAVRVALVVGFERNTEFLWWAPPDDGDPLQKLNALVEAGGECVGLIGFTMGGGQGQVYARALADYGGGEWVGKYLASLTERFAAEARRLPGVIAVEKPADPANN